MDGIRRPGAVWWLACGGALALSGLAVLLWATSLRQAAVAADGKRAGPDQTSAAPPAAPEQTPEQTVAELEATAGRKGADARPLVDALARHGTAALPIIKQKLGKAGEHFNMLLVRAANGIEGADDEVASLLLSQFVDNPYPSARGEALWLLDNRVRVTAVKRPLREAELTKLTQTISAPNIFSQGYAARVLSRCVQVPTDQRVAPIVERYEKEVVSPTKGPPIDPKPYFSDRVFLLNQFLLAIDNIGAPAVPRLAMDRRSAGGDQELRKWLTIALGWAGDRSVSDELQGLLQTEADTSTKIVLVRAYAKAGKQEALPFLRSIVDSEDMKSVQWILKEEIRQLEESPGTRG